MYTNACEEEKGGLASPPKRATIIQARIHPHPRANNNVSLSVVVTVWHHPHGASLADVQATFLATALVARLLLGPSLTLVTLYTRPLPAERRQSLRRCHAKNARACRQLEREICHGPRAILSGLHFDLHHFRPLFNRFPAHRHGFVVHLRPGRPSAAESVSANVPRCCRPQRGVDLSTSRGPPLIGLSFISCIVFTFPPLLLAFSMA